MNTNNLVIMTSQPEFSHAAVSELQQFDPELEDIEEFVPGIVLCKTSNAPILMHKAACTLPIFVHHLAPTQAIVELESSERDIGKLAIAIASLPSFTQLERGIHFAVQSRLIQVDKNRGERLYSSGQLNQTLAAAFAQETGAIESIKKPQIVISLLCTSSLGYVGITTTEENLSSWPGGARHFAQTPEQISRAEFKLLEALEVFGVALPSKGHALDLGAAPGGWTRLLLNEGLTVTAVDPASLDSRLAEYKHLIHFRGYAEDYLQDAIHKQQRFNIIVNDMRMDAREAARLLVRAALCLHLDGFIISVLKLPHTTHTINPLVTLREALDILRKQYQYVHARQLFHNRQEVTVIAAHPSGKRKR